jgi:A118 family predicted phage portal protein|nr:MAG TPA: portal protein [Caudoviricetes sp.]
MELYNNISSVLSKKNGINLAVGDIYDYMQIWKEWLAGDVADFHHYKVKLASGTTVNKEILTMNMPKKVCEDMAKLLWTEKTQIQLKRKKDTIKLWSILDNKVNNFTTNFPIFIEQVMGLGNGALIEYKDNGVTTIDYVTGDLVIPYKYTNSYVYGLITVSRYSEIEDAETNKEKTFYYTHITYHEHENGKYKRKHELYKSENDNELGNEINFNEIYPDIEKEDEIETDVPYFQVLKPNLANNLDMSSPLGISIFANSIDRFKAIDLKYDSFSREFVLGKKRILVDNTTLKAKAIPNENGKIDYVQQFDANDEVYVAVEGMEKQPAKEIDFTLRTKDHIDAINAELNWLSSNVGLGENYYKFDGVSVKTATEVISENSKAFRTRTRHLINVNDVVYDLVRAICHIEGIDASDIVITPDDSIITDKNAEKTLALMEVQQGLKSKKSYLIKFEGMTEQQAQEELDKINEEKMTNQEVFGFPTDEGQTINKEENKKKNEEKEE